MKYFVTLDVFYSHLHLTR